MTPDEAKTKWCPYVRAQLYQRTHNDNPPVNRDSWAPDCIAGDCMAWRWSRAKETKAFLVAVQAEMKAKGIDFARATQSVFADRGATFEQTEGYCGLAGKSE